MAANEYPNLKSWKPGQSGNPRGRPPDRPIAKALRDLMDKNDGEAIRALASVCLKKALKGNFQYAREILDRVDGKVADRVITEDDGDDADRQREVFARMFNNPELLKKAMALHDEIEANDGAT